MSLSVCGRSPYRASDHVWMRLLLPPRLRIIPQTRITRMNELRPMHCLLGSQLPSLWRWQHTTSDGSGGLTKVSDRPKCQAHWTLVLRHAWQGCCWNNVTPTIFVTTATVAPPLADPRRLSTQMRTFAVKGGGSKGAKGAAKDDNTKSSKLLCNEKLVAAIMSKYPQHDSAEDVQVRMVNEKMEAEKKTTVSEIVSLAQAIQTAIDEDLDMIEIAIHQEVPVPVIKLGKLASIIYREKQKLANNKPGLARKEFSFKVGIADNDLQRQVERMKGFLEKGHTCLIRIRCPGWMAEKEPTSTETFLNQMMTQLQEVSEPLTQADYSETRNSVKIVIQKKSK